MVEMLFLLTHLRLQGEGKKRKRDPNLSLTIKNLEKRVVESAKETRLAWRLRLSDRTVQSSDHTRLFLSLLNPTLTTSESFLHVCVVMLTSRDRFV